MFIVKFLFVIFVIGFLAALRVVWKIYRRIMRNAAEQLKQQGGGAQDKGGYAQSHQRSTTTANGDTIIDTRNQEQANKKIFSKDEGEYVDFKEK